MIMGQIFQIFLSKKTLARPNYVAPEVVTRFPRRCLRKTTNGVRWQNGVVFFYRVGSQPCDALKKRSKIAFGVIFYSLCIVLKNKFYTRNKDRGINNDNIMITYFDVLIH